jgi:hypothetical protein
MFGPVEFLLEWLTIRIQAFRLSRVRKQSGDWPTALGTIKPSQVLRATGFLAPDAYRCVLGYAFRANDSRYAGFFVIWAQDEENAQRLQKAAAEMKIRIRFNPQNPDVSLVDDERLMGREITQNPHWLL